MASGFRMAQAYVEVTADTTEAEKEASGLGAKISKGLGAGMAAAGAAGAGLLAKGFADSMNIEVANDKLAGQLGLTSAEADKAGKAAGAVYRQNWGGSIEEVNAAIQSVGSSMADVGATTQADLEAMASKALALAGTFDVDVNRSTEAAGALIKNGLAKDSAEAFDILTAGFQNGANKADDFTETLTEYSPQFAKLGISGQQAMGILSAGLQAGARDTDVIADAFKEFSLRSIDGSKLTAEGFKAIGLDAKYMAGEIAKGGPAAEAATQQTLQSLLAIKDPVAQNAAGVALF
ncbi:MAG TPA: phage tail tape measure protein, partial [Mycolicibacterium fallax]|nr:phage tail tape measure protein [Mycolicibacterium fallax]